MIYSERLRPTQRGRTTTARHSGGSWFRPIVAGEFRRFLDTAVDGDGKSQLTILEIKSDDDRDVIGGMTMTILDQQPLTLSIPLYEDPPGVLRVGKSRVLLELVIRAFQRGQTPESIVQSYDTLSLPHVFAVVSNYLANPAPFDDHLRRCDQQAQAVRRK